MAKVMKCRTVGLDCDFVARGENDEQIMAQVAEHAKKPQERPPRPSRLTLGTSDEASYRTSQGLP